MDQAEIRRRKKLEYCKQYRIDRAEEIREKRREQVRCECGLLTRKQHLGRHMQSLLHHKEIEKRKQILEERTNPDIANLILSFL